MIKSFFSGILLAIPFVLVGLIILSLQVTVEDVSSYDNLQVKMTAENGYVIEVGGRATAVSGKYYFNRQQVPLDGDIVSTAIIQDVQYLAYGKLTVGQWRAWWIVHQVVEWVVWVIIYAAGLLLIVWFVWRK